MKVLITIDVEAHRGETPIETFVWGRMANGKKYGLELIVNTLISQKLTGVFFIDFAEIFDYGEEAIACIVNYLVNKGQSIGLHLHPDHFGDKTRTFLWEYSYEEQLKMISICAESFKKLTGKWPIIFRAGKFGANDNTIAILDRLKIPFDSSCYYKHRWCKITKQNKSNAPYRITPNVIEVPVSLFCSIKCGKKELRYDQIDLGCNSIEFRHSLINQRKIDDNVIITAFFHSFSFFPHRKNPERVRFSNKVLMSFVKNLQFLEDHDGIVIGIEELPAVTKSLCIKTNRDTDYPVSGGWLLQFICLLQRSFSIVQTNLKAKLLLITTSIISGSLIILICFVIKSVIS